MKTTPLLALALFVCGMSAAAAQDVAQAAATTDATANVLAGTTPTKFLNNYTRLTPSLSSNNDFQSYTAVGVSARSLGRVVIMPIITFPENATFPYIDRATMAELQSELMAEVNKVMQDKSIVVATPDQADSIIQLAVTGVTAVEPDRRPRDYLPFRLITRPIKDATMGKEQEIRVTLELRIRNAKTNQTIFESLTRANGKTMGRADESNLRADIKELDPVLDTWTAQFRKSIATLQAAGK